MIFNAFPFARIDVIKQSTCLVRQWRINGWQAVDSAGRWREHCGEASNTPAGSGVDGDREGFSRDAFNFCVSEPGACGSQY